MESRRVRPSEGSRPHLARGRRLAAPGAAAVALVLLGAVEAHAYIDLGTGSYVFQVAVASLLGGLFALKAYWAKIRDLFGRRRDRRDDP